MEFVCVCLTFMLKTTMPFLRTNSAQGKAAGTSAKSVQVDGVLAALIGPGLLPVTEITKKVWEYIRHHGLENPQNGSNINADERWHDRKPQRMGTKKPWLLFLNELS